MSDRFDIATCRQRLRVIRQTLAAYEAGARAPGWTTQAEQMRIHLQDEVSYWQDQLFWARVRQALDAEKGDDYAIERQGPNTTPTVGAIGHHPPGA